MSSRCLSSIIRRGHVEELVCTLCGKHIGWVSVFDMNENYELCDTCVPVDVDKGEEWLKGKI